MTSRRMLEVGTSKIEHTGRGLAVFLPAAQYLALKLQQAGRLKEAEGLRKLDLQIDEGCAGGLYICCTSWVYALGRRGGWRRQGNC